jgi:DNA-binding transcriptional ArsR family regulator
MNQLSQLSRSFAALAEPTRLRLMLACRERELLVGQLARVLGLPEPAVSRHLATLARAGLLRRTQSGREVRYGWSAEARDSTWLSTALAPLRGADAAQRRDQSRLARLAERQMAAPVLADSLFGQRLAAGFRQLANNIGSARALAVDVSHGPVLAWLQESAAELRIAAAHPGLRRALGAYGREHGLAFEWAGNTGAEADFDLVCVAAAAVTDLERSLASAARWLAPQGRVLLGLPYDALEDSAAAGGAHPLFRLRALLAAQGFSCERLLPVEAAGEHWLLASGLQSVRASGAVRQGHDS